MARCLESVNILKQLEGKSNGWLSLPWLPFGNFMVCKGENVLSLRVSFHGINPHMSKLLSDRSILPLLREIFE